MSTLSIRLPDSLHERLKEAAWKEGISILMTVDYLKERAAQGDRHAFEDILSKVPDVQPDEMDRIR